MGQPKIIEMLKSRKFWFSIITITIATYLFMTGQIDVDHLTDTIRVTANVYVGALAFEDGLKKALPLLSELLNGNTKK